MMTIRKMMNNQAQSFLKKLYFLFSFKMSFQPYNYFFASLFGE